MKRDMDLIREILLQVEARENPNSWKVEKVEIEGRDNQEIDGHVHLLLEAGFVGATSAGGPVNRLTWEGHELLDSICDPTVWATVTEKLKEVGGAASLEVVRALAVGVVKDQLGLDG